MCKSCIAMDYQKKILELLEQRDLGKTICPSEVLPAELKQDPLIMEEVRDSARALAQKGMIEITQKGKAVDPQNFRGPIRLRLRRQ